MLAYWHNSASKLWEISDSLQKNTLALPCGLEIKIIFKTFLITTEPFLKPLTLFSYFSPIFFPVHHDFVSDNISAIGIIM